MSSEIDYLLQVEVANKALHNTVYQKMINNVRLTDGNPYFAMEEMKHLTPLPLPTIIN